MTWTDKRGQWLALRCNKRFFEGDPLVARQDGLSDADQTIAITHKCRHVCHLVTTGLALLRIAAELLERFEKEGFDVMRLQTAGFGTLHVLADAVNAARIHGVVSQCMLFQEV